MLRFLLITLVGLAVVSCSNQVDPTVDLRDDPMQSVFESISNDIQSLSNIGRLKVWLAGCDSHFQIQNEADLLRAISYFGEIPQHEVDNLHTQFKNSDTMYFFGFECDYSVIVGFREHGSQFFIFPANYSPH